MEITLQSGPQWRKMTAKYAGRCITCGKSIAVGDAILYASGWGAKHATHTKTAKTERSEAQRTADDAAQRQQAYIERMRAVRLRRQNARQADDEWADAHGWR